MKTFLISYGQNPQPIIGQTSLISELFILVVRVFCRCPGSMRDSGFRRFIDLPFSPGLKWAVGPKSKQEFAYYILLF